MFGVEISLKHVLLYDIGKQYQRNCHLEFDEKLTGKLTVDT